MTEITTQATVDGEKRAVVINYNLGNDLESAVNEIGQDQVYSLYVRGATLAVQQKVGAMLRAGTSDEEITSTMSEWRLDQRGTRTRKSKEDKARALFEGMDVDQIRATLEGLGIKVK
tara:strand:- start:4944 stop:5294 length:351 start_codon:yes stop_codon:yes gene_type:complete